LHRKDHTIAERTEDLAVQEGEKAQVQLDFDQALVSGIDQTLPWWRGQFKIVDGSKGCGGCND